MFQCNRSIRSTTTSQLKLNLRVHRIQPSWQFRFDRISKDKTKVVFLFVAFQVDWRVELWAQQNRKRKIGFCLLSFIFSRKMLAYVSSFSRRRGTCFVLTCAWSHSAQFVGMKHTSAPWSEFKFSNAEGNRAFCDQRGTMYAVSTVLFRPVQNDDAWSGRRQPGCITYHFLRVINVLLSNAGSLTLLKK